MPIVTSTMMPSVSVTLSRALYEELFSGTRKRWSPKPKAPRRKLRASRSLSKVWVISTLWAGAVAKTFPASFEEDLSRRETIGDRLLCAVRARFGLDVGALDREASLDGALARGLAPTLEALVAEGLLERAGHRLAPTERGFAFNDAVARRLLSAIDELLL